MVLAIISVLLLVILILIAVYIGLNRGEVEQVEEENSMIHASGIYSIVRKSPREEAMKARPDLEEIRKYLLSSNVDTGKYQLSERDQDILLEHWDESLKKNIAVIEQGDKEGVEFYYYEFVPEDCPVCKRYFSRGHFVTREEIFHHPRIIPPFHPGCTTSIFPHHGKEDLRDTTELGMLPLFKEDVPPPLPEWNAIVKPNALWGSTA